LQRIRAPTYPSITNPPLPLQHSLLPQPAPTAARRGAASMPAPDLRCAQQRRLWRASACRASTSQMSRSRTAPSNPKPSDALHSSSVKKNEMLLDEAPTATRRALASPKRRVNDTAHRLIPHATPSENDSSDLPCIKEARLPLLQPYVPEAADVNTPARRRRATRHVRHTTSEASRRAVQRGPRCHAVAVRTLRTEYVQDSPPRGLRFRSNHMHVLGIYLDVSYP
jgi:hypothetical protein